MKILYDYQGLTQEVGGVSRCFCEYISILRKTNEVKIACPVTSNIYIQDILGIKKSVIMRPKHFWGQTEVQLLLNRIASLKDIAMNNFDIFHPTFDSRCYYSKIIKRPYVLTVHDLIPEIYYRNASKKPVKLDKWLYSKEKALRGASRIMCVSKFTKKNLLEYYPFLNSSKIDIVYHGIHPFMGKYKENIYGKYILYVGNRIGYKNFLFTIESLLPLLRKYKDLFVLCTGANFTKEELQYLAEWNLINQIVQVGYVDDYALSSLYHNALCFIFPSLYEGFGIPILESFVNECPACIAETTCFPEIAEEAASYFDPHDKDSILTSVTKVIEDKEFANTLRRKGLERAKLFTWENSTNKVLQTYQNALK